MREEQEIKVILSEQLGVRIEKLVPEANLRDDLGADSLDEVELMMSLEHQFDIDIPDEDVDKFTTVKEVIDYVISRTDGA